MGDFNAIRGPNEKIGGAVWGDTYCDDLNNCCREANLDDLRYMGNHFTWSNSSVGQKRIACKLDRALVNEGWSDVLPDSYAHFLNPSISDHSPYVVNCGGGEERRKRSRNSIKEVCLDDGTFVSDKGEVKKEFVNYFKKVLNSTNVCNLNVKEIQRLVNFQLESQVKEMMIKEVEEDEIKATIFAMDNNKAPGPDGYGAFFFKAAWEVVGSDVTKAIKHFFSTGRLLKEILANRLKAILPNFIDKAQGAFVGGRNIGENIMLCQELMHNFHKLGKDKKADGDSISLMKNTLSLFHKWSGLKMNCAKSNMYLSGVSQEEKKQFSAIINMELGELPFKYLGVPITSSKLKCGECKILIQKIVGRITSWRSKALSYAGRLILIRAVLFSIQIYWSSIFILPSSIHKEIDGILRNFLWSGASMEGKKAKVAWEEATWKLKDNLEPKNDDEVVYASKGITPPTLGSSTTNIPLR
ncbi:uncharacterized protein LOC123194970 [Mangifera indica]|uniref:uncharacterized protein LOC123194970 n=1 Tax=Mangifera indica TaxID=29780 RepID=UPI001CF9A008|nr:uncharacterized protein LOC123194970 [Mangifera indica]